MSQDLNWAYSVTNTNVQDHSNFIASNGNEFVLIGRSIDGVILDIIDKDPNATGEEKFVAKYDSLSQLQWYIEHPGGGTAASTEIAFVDASGNVFCIGRFSGTMDFDPTSGTSNYTANGGDLFVQKLNTNGELEWVGHTNGSGQPQDVAQKSNGNLVIVGRSQSDITVELSNGDSSEVKAGVFIYEFSSTGDALSAYSISTPESFNTEVNVSIDQDDNVIVGASIAGTMDLGLKSTPQTDVSISAYDAVVAKYDDEYNYMWHKVFGDTVGGQPGGWDYVGGIQTDASNNIYVAGHFTWTTDFDPTDNPRQWVRFADDGSQTPNGYVLKYNADGEIQWIQDAGGTDSVTSNNTGVRFWDLAILGDVLIAGGSMEAGADFDSNGDFILYGTGPCHSVYSNTGDFKTAWVIDAYPVGIEYNGTEALSGGVLTTGRFQQQVDFDPTTGEHFLFTDSTGLYPDYDFDIFLAHYKLDGIVGVDPMQTSESMDWNVYPNPVNGNSVVIKSSEAVNASRVQAISIAGQSIPLKMNRLSSGDIELNIDRLDAGIYILTIDDQVAGKLVRL